MTLAAAIVVGVLIFLAALVFYYLGVGAGWQRGYSAGVLDTVDLLADEDDGAEAYFRKFGGRIDAGRRREN